MKKYKKIAGKFAKVSDNPIVIGTIGNVFAAQLPNDQIEYMKAFFGAAGRNHRIINDFLVSINRSMYNDFIIIE